MKPYNDLQLSPSAVITAVVGSNYHNLIMAIVIVNSQPLTAPLSADTSELQDVEIAHEIQEELVRQAEQQRKQEEKDAVRTTLTRLRTHQWMHSSIISL